MTKGKPQTTKNNTAQENLTERLERKETVRGTAFTITGGFLWGIAGVFGKYTFEYKGVTATWIVCTSDHCRDHIIDQSVYGAEGRNIPYLEK